MDELKNVSVDDAWHVWGAGGYAHPDLLHKTVQFAHKYNVRHIRHIYIYIYIIPMKGSKM